MITKGIHIRGIIWLHPSEWERCKVALGPRGQLDVHEAAIQVGMITGSYLLRDAVGMYDSFILKLETALEPTNGVGMVSALIESMRDNRSSGAIAKKLRKSILPTLKRFLKKPLRQSNFMEKWARGHHHQSR